MSLIVLGAAEKKSDRSVLKIEFPLKLHTLSDMNPSSILLSVCNKQTKKTQCSTKNKYLGLKKKT